MLYSLNVSNILTEMAAPTTAVHPATTCPRTMSATAADKSPERTRKKPDRLGMSTCFLASTTQANIIKEPTGYKGVMTSEEASKRLAAMSAVMEFLHENETCDLVELPPGCKVIKSK